jgi:hypothetical protein
LRTRPRDHETPDPTPLEIPGGAGTPENLHDMISRFVKSEVSRFRAAAEGEEPEETAALMAALDSDEGEDPSLTTPYSVVEMESEHSLTVEELYRAAEDLILNPPQEQMQGETGDVPRETSFPADNPTPIEASPSEASTTQ